MAVSGVSANRIELLQIARAVAQEKSIDQAIVIDAMQDAIQKAAKSRYGLENDIRCTIDPKTGETRLTRVMTVVEDVENEATELTVDQAKRRKSDAALGDVLGSIVQRMSFSIPYRDFAAFWIASCIASMTMAWSMD
ncbi:MAG: NusA N-terminal domain-containing protein, partial [Pseudomonadota bacterium]